MDGNDLLLLGGVFFGFLLLSKQVTAGTASVNANGTSSLATLAAYMKNLLSSASGGSGSGAKSGGQQGNSGNGPAFQGANSPSSLHSAGNGPSADEVSNWSNLLADLGFDQAIDANGGLEAVSVTATPGDPDSYIQPVDTPTSPTDIFASGGGPMSGSDPNNGSGSAGDMEDDDGEDDD